MKAINYLSILPSVCLLFHKIVSRGDSSPPVNSLSRENEYIFTERRNPSKINQTTGQQGFTVEGESGLLETFSLVPLLLFPSLGLTLETETKRKHLTKTRLDSISPGTEESINRLRGKRVRANRESSTFSLLFPFSLDIVITEDEAATLVITACRHSFSSLSRNEVYVKFYFFSSQTIMNPLTVYYVDLDFRVTELPLSQ